MDTAPTQFGPQPGAFDANDQRSTYPESCASLAATTCSMSVSRVEAKQVPVYGP